MFIRFFKTQLLFFSLLLCGINLQSQSFTISGFMTDASSGEVLIGAYVFCPQTGTGSITNSAGYYAINIPNGNKNLMFLQDGYIAKIDTILIHRNNQMDVSLRELSEYSSQIDPFINANKWSAIDEDEEDYLDEDDSNFVVRKIQLKNPEPINELIHYVLSRNFKIIDRLDNGLLEIPGEQINKMPSLAGEIDVIRTLKHLPGIMPGTELTNGIYVRGGGQDQNLVLIDGMPIYNMNHAFGFYSIFNSESLNSINISKSGYSSRHGGRLSAITDVNTKEGNKNGIHGIYQNSFLAMTLNLDGPLSRDGRTTFSFAGRRSYLDLLIFRPINTDSSKFHYTFYDVNFKVAHRIDKKNKLVFNIYSNRDRFYTKDITVNTINNKSVVDESFFDIRWGNFASSVQWNRVISERLFSTASIGYSQYKSQITLGFASQFDSANVINRSEIDYKYINFIKDYNGKIEYNYILNKSNTIHTGANFSFKQFLPGTTETKFNNNGIVNNDTFFGLSSPLNSTEMAVYLENEYRLNQNIKMTFGGRFVQYIHNKQNYTFIEPRISFNSKIDNTYAIKASYTVMNQNLHLLADNVNSNLFSLNFDRWVPATEFSRPERAHQVTLGFSQPLKNDFELNIDGYYKYMNRVLEVKEGVDINGGLLSETDWESKVVEGKAWNYGLETFLHKRRGDFTGWISYALSWAVRNTPGVNRDQNYFYQFDRRHYFNLVAQTYISENLSGSINIVFSTGNVQSVPIGKYLDANGNVIYDYTEKNNYRLNNTFRIDIGLTKTKYKDYDVESGYKFSLYNALARNNPAFIFIDNSQSPPVAKQRAFLIFIPGITYYIKF